MMTHLDVSAGGMRGRGATHDLIVIAAGVDEWVERDMRKGEEWVERDMRKVEEWGKRDGKNEEDKKNERVKEGKRKTIRDK